jgi:hypothetical protein
MSPKCAPHDRQQTKSYVAHTRWSTHEIPAKQHVQEFKLRAVQRNAYRSCTPRTPVGRFLRYLLSFRSDKRFSEALPC